MVFRYTFDITDFGAIEGWDVYTTWGQYMGHVDGTLSMAIEAVETGEVGDPVSTSESEIDDVSLPHPRCPFDRAHGLMVQILWDVDQNDTVHVVWRCNECNATVEMSTVPGEATDDASVLWIPADE